jgi:hypothetical protein
LVGSGHEQLTAFPVKEQPERILWNYRPIVNMPGPDFPGPAAARSCVVSEGRNGMPRLAGQATEISVIGNRRHAAEPIFLTHKWPFDIQPDR